MPKSRSWRGELCEPPKFLRLGRRRARGTRSSSRKGLPCIGRLQQTSAAVGGEVHTFKDRQRGGAFRRGHGGELLGGLRMIRQVLDGLFEEGFAARVVFGQAVEPFHRRFGLKAPPFGKGFAAGDVRLFGG